MKCQFGMEHCVYLGHVVGGGAVHPEASKVEAVEQFKVPDTKKQVRAFLGLTGYYRKFISNYATVAAPLTDLTRKSAPNNVQWNEQCDQAFKELKKLLCTAPVLRNPDFSRPFILQMDPSDRGVGAVLSHAEGREWRRTPAGIFQQEAVAKRRTIFHRREGVLGDKAWDSGISSLSAGERIHNSDRPLFLGMAGQAKREQCQID